MKEKTLIEMLVMTYGLSESAAVPLRLWDVAEDDGRKFKSGCLGLELPDVISSKVCSFYVSKSDFE